MRFYAVFIDLISEYEKRWTLLCILRNLSLFVVKNLGFLPSEQKKNRWNLFHFQLGCWQTNIKYQIEFRKLKDFTRAWAVFSDLFQRTYLFWSTPTLLVFFSNSVIQFRLPLTCFKLISRFNEFHGNEMLEIQD